MCPKCGSNVFGGNARYPGAKYCPSCCYLSYPDQQPDFVFTKEQFKAQVFPKKLSQYDPCPVIGCGGLIRRGSKRRMCASCSAKIYKWKLRGSKGPEPIFVNENDELERLVHNDGT